MKKETMVIVLPEGDVSKKTKDRGGHVTQSSRVAKTKDQLYVVTHNANVNLKKGTEKNGNSGTTDKSGIRSALQPDYGVAKTTGNHRQDAE